MSESQAARLGPASENQAGPSTSVVPRSGAARVFVGSKGLRGGWRVLIFLVLLASAIAGFIRLFHALGVRQPPGVISPGISLLGEIFLFIAVMLATGIMGQFEGRGLGAYGLPLREGFLKRFGLGAIWGLVPLVALLLVLRALGVLDFGGPDLAAKAVLRSGVLWGLVFLLTGLFEECAVRGYPQFTLTRSVGFWWSAVITSLILAVAHVGNSGEAMVGLIAVFCVGMVACLMLRRTGDLWFPIGFHFSWDYAESFIFGVPNSGSVAVGHLLTTHMHGSKWLTGGSVGPEASILAFVVLGLTALIFNRVYPQHLGIRHSHEAESYNAAVSKVE